MASLIFFSAKAADRIVTEVAEFLDTSTIPKVGTFFAGLIRLGQFLVKETLNLPIRFVGGIATRFGHRDRFEGIAYKIVNPFMPSVEAQSARERAFDARMANRWASFVAELAQRQQRVGEREKQLDARSSQLAASESDLRTRTEQLAADEVRLAESEAQLATGQAQLATKETQLATSAAQLAAKQEAFEKLPLRPVQSEGIASSAPPRESPRQPPSNHAGDDFAGNQARSPQTILTALVYGDIAYAAGTRTTAAQKARAAATYDRIRQSVITIDGVDAVIAEQRVTSWLGADIRNALRGLGRGPLAIKDKEMLEAWQKLGQQICRNGLGRSGLGLNGAGAASAAIIRAVLGTNSSDEVTRDVGPLDPCDPIPFAAKIRLIHACEAVRVIAREPTAREAAVAKRAEQAEVVASRSTAAPAPAIYAEATLD